LGRIDDAEAESQQLAAKYPDKPQGREGLARVAVLTHQHDLALERWEKIIEQFPEHIPAHVGKGNALIELGKIDEAKALFQELVDKYPDKPQGLENLAKLAVRNQEWETALKYWEECIGKFPKNMWFEVGKANALMQLERLAEAEVIFQQIKQEYPDKPQGMEGLTRLARISGNIELSLAYSEQLIARFPESNIGYWEKEQAFIELGRFEEANAAFLARPSAKNTNVIKRKKPVNFPQDLVLPEMVGVNNDYTFLEEQVKEFVASGKEYKLPVSIIIPVYNRKEILAKTLAAITHQTYPKDLIEVVIVDDGSSDEIVEVIRKYENYLELIYTRQTDKGYRVAAARNLGMRAARHDYFITLDCDILPYPELVESYMKWFHVTDKAILIGHRRYVCSDAITDDEILENIDVALNLPDIIPNNEVVDAVTRAGISYDWRFPIYVRTNYKKEQKWPFQGYAAGNVAYPRKAIELAGNYDETFQHWGKEDNEIAYRFYNAGYYFIPIMEAMSVHQEPPGGKNETDREAGFEVTKKIIEQKCPAPIYRNYRQGEMYEIPKVSIYIPAYNAAKFIKEAVDSALNQTYTDLEVCICDDGSTDETLKVLEENYADNPRVRWVSQPNGGIGKASNTAVRMCRGMYIGQLDADDLLKPNAVELAVNYLDKNDVGFVYSSYEVIDAEGNFVREQKPGIEFSREALLQGMCVTHFRMFRKRDWMRTTGFDEELVNAVDYDMYLKLSEICYGEHLDSVNYCYRWHGENTSIKQRKNQEVNHFLVIDKALARLGLGDVWEAVQGDISNPRSVKFQRKNEGEKEVNVEGIKATEIDSEPLVMRIKLAYELMEQGKIQEAIKELNQALNLPGDKTPIYQGLGDAYRRIELEEARAYGRSK